VVVHRVSAARADYAPTMHATRQPAGISPTTARKTWRTVEPVHGMIYFAPESANAYAGLGLKTEAGYFASRAAPMGAVSADVVVATFFNFNPRLVHAVIPEAWQAVTPTALCEARLQAADGALRRLIGEDAVSSKEMRTAADLARRAAEQAAERPAGRPLFAGHAGLPWPEPPHLVLWHAQSCLREFRGDGHIAALTMAGLDPVEALVVHVASGEVPMGFLRSSRGWSDDEWDAGVERVQDRGWLESAASDDGRGTPPPLNEKGRSARQHVEDETDRMATYAYEALGEEGCEQLRTLVRPLSKSIVANAGFGVSTS